MAKGVPRQYELDVGAVHSPEQVGGVDDSVFVLTDPDGAKLGGRWWVG
jgi:hypothetical protein